MATTKTDPFVLAFDTANEVISIAVGLLHAETQTLELVASRQVAAHRASNIQLLLNVDELITEQGIDRDQIACVACGRGPGSFTGVRICMASAKGVASALEVPLVGVSTLDALAWELQAAGVRGRVFVVADAMRKEVYPQVYHITDTSIGRSSADTVVPVARFEATPEDSFVLVAGDALAKYAQVFEPWGPLAPEEQWRVQGPGLLAAMQDAWQAGDCDPFDAQRHNPAFLLPVYTRLSDAEEHEREKLADASPRDLRTGVSGASQANQQFKTDGLQFSYRPLAAADVDQVVALEASCMGSDAWKAAQLTDEIPRKDRSWWVALDDQGAVVAYAGGQMIDGQFQLFKIATTPDQRRNGIAHALLERLSEDARNLGANEMTLEVRVSNTGAQDFYQAHGLDTVGTRPAYYSDGEDAIIMTGPLPAPSADVAGMEVFTTSEAIASTPKSFDKPLIMAIETSCDETAAALIDGSGTICSDAIASQIDFHARFGGVVPEIASRKHIEAICGVGQVCLEQAGGVHYRDLDAIACTYAPGLVGALVVGVAFAKGVAWGANIPYIQVNHLEGHLYANKLATPDIQPPMVVSLVSGGHTMLVHVRDWGEYEILGSTIDDAVGEAFDKVAKALGLGYPGGPIISRYAETGNPAAIDFPRAMLHSHDFRFSLSGLKTAVVTYIAQQLEAGHELNIPDIAASFQAAVIDVQVAKARTALEETGAREFCLGGGVAANPALRAAYEKLCAEMEVRLTLPPLSACTDNASMIALVALDRYYQHKFAPLSADAFAHSNLEEDY
ncbi:MAG: tRNA (adenosine(37)-N6)-threonylcarbamoyltransferase complex transferase subunit TsaD [Eggerthellaceae bacterium]|nr:tRNA (adenosine(37)-N6)-threonylcarbamoyltransferase complex transferase subunit TsaD [Eggerthellaceae bacterium]